MPLLREIRRNIPHGMNIKIWMDEYEILAGQSIRDSLRDAITKKADFFIIFLGIEAVRSRWVRQEFGWARKREREIGRRFVIPVVLDRAALREMPKSFQDKRHLTIASFTEDGIREFTRLLLNEIMKWLAELRGWRAETAPGAIPLIRELAAIISDDQVNCSMDKALSEKRLKSIVSGMDLNARVELLILYELTYGKYRLDYQSLNLDRANFLQAKYGIHGVGEFQHTLDWTENPFAQLQIEYGLGDSKHQVRAVFLEALDKIGENGRRDLFAGLEIVKFWFER